MFKQLISSQQGVSRKLCTMFLVLGLISCLFIGESMAGGKGGGGDDIILYNGNIVLRGNGGKGKGKGKGKGGGGTIVVANSPPQHEYMPMYDHHWGGHGGFRRRRQATED